MTKILAGAVVGHDPAVVEPYAETLQQTADAADAEVDFAFILDPEAETEALSDLLPGYVEVGAEKPEDAEYAVHEQTHAWSEPTFNWLGAQKQSLLDLAEENRYDKILLADSDLILGENTLPSLLSTEKPLVSAVFYTRWQRGSQALPQCWLRNPYGFTGRGYDDPHEFLRELEQRRLTRVWGLGACTLIDTDILNAVHYHPPIQGLPQGGMWRGEDRSFCVRAERSHVPMYADPWPDVAHIYRPSQRSEISDFREEIDERNRLTAPKLDRLVSFILEPLEEPGLANHREIVRGCLGRLDMLPDIRQVLLDMRPGEDRLVRVEFPRWWPEMPVNTPQGQQDLAARYRGEDKLMRVTLLDVKPDREPIKP